MNRRWMGEGSSCMGDPGSCGLCSFGYSCFERSAGRIKMAPGPLAALVTFVVIGFVAAAVGGAF